LAAEKNPALLDFEIPVNIAVDLDEISQMCHFLIVNTTQRSVDRAIEQQIVARLTKVIGLEKTPTMPRWIRRQVEKGEARRRYRIVQISTARQMSREVAACRLGAGEALHMDASSLRLGIVLRRGRH
jgi:hypothetical protein